jgi:CheY-like chemotaxis protein
MNLCTNAAQAMRDEKGVLTIGLDRIEFRQPPEAISELAPGPYVRLTVGDTGQGIPAEIRDRIFEPYFTTKLRDEGTGLGLATVHGIVSNHGGAVTVDSRVGQGTLFYVYFPAAPATRDAGGDREIVPETGTGKILFVDDEEALADLGRAALERLGYRVHAECDSLQALETFHRAPHDFDLLITDQTMPGLTGLELSRSVLDVRPDLPIIICTGFSRSVTPEKAREIGVKGFLMKPIVLTELAKKVKQVLETD